MKTKHVFTLNTVLAAAAAGTRRPEDVPESSLKALPSRTYRGHSGDQYKTSLLNDKDLFRSNRPCITCIFLFLQEKQMSKKSK